MTAYIIISIVALVLFILILRDTYRSGYDNGWSGGFHRARWHYDTSKITHDKKEQTMTNPDPNTPQPLTPAEVARMSEIESKYAGEPTGEDTTCSVCSNPVHVPDCLEWEDGDECCECLDEYAKEAHCFVPRAIATIRHLEQTVRERDASLEQFAFVKKVMTLAVQHDFTSEIWWSGDAKPHIICSDVFSWGTADVEEITPNNLPLLEAAIADCHIANKTYGDIWGPTLFVARVRKCRPQGAAYPKDHPEMWPLFDAAGPEREIGFGNPCKPGEYRSPPNKAKQLDALLREVLPYIVAEGSGIDRRIRKAVGE